MFQSNFQSKARGVAIVISNNVRFTVSKVQTESAGRYVIVVGELYTLPVFSPVFMHQIGTILCFLIIFFSLLPNMSTHNLIIGGDINCILSSLDRSTLRKTPLTKSAQSINLFLETYGIADVWRFRNPTSRAYSFFSPVYKTYSCIDCFFLNKRILHSIVECDNEAIVVSDHGPLSMKILVPDTQPIYRPW